MQFGPLIGIGVALFAILLGNALEGGHMGSMVGGPAALIVLAMILGLTLPKRLYDAAGFRVRGRS